MLGSIVVVVVAVLAFLITGSPDPDQAAAAPRSTAPSSEPTALSEPERQDKPKSEQRDQRQKKPAKPTAYVEVYNNSGLTGLAGDTAGQLSGAGWNVLGTDNWYGEIPATTVYYGPGLKGQAQLLADEVDAPRIRPAVQPMGFDRLTLILTGDL